MYKPNMQTVSKKCYKARDTRGLSKALKQNLYRRKNPKNI
ncbi:Uncharacterised protein [Orientia tsutsugamushi]|nr:hypothetical protein OTSKATO_1435 [Orientia tsutsugamushi str. Kato PP]KJV73991.1 hypothetical protein OTSTA763_1319 [Orientia tsutsugamushi str. TA763]KJV85791.1 hypothetical protein OTSUT76_1684 [Orientia tsutsugamushi str. UT76]SPP24225.1 Uncharacterised protein [Orientia tsutsugamushi]SPR12338.1 Uncharacterised protein [Orientia tsutsugamushi]